MVAPVRHSVLALDFAISCLVSIFQNHELQGSYQYEDRKHRPENVNKHMNK